MKVQFLDLLTKTMLLLTKKMEHIHQALLTIKVIKLTLPLQLMEKMVATK